MFYNKNLFQIIEPIDFLSQFIVDHVEEIWWVGDDLMMIFDFADRQTDGRTYKH